MDPRERDEANGVRAGIERCFRQIETERMAGIPILNRALRVEVVGLQRLGDEWLSILLTPWFMNVMLLPHSDSRSDGRAGVSGQDAGTSAVVGSKTTAHLPAGRFEMIQGFEAAIGHYRMCSLFSPVLEFADHESAVQAAEAALAALLDQDCAREEDPGMEMIWRGERPADAVHDRPSDHDSADTDSALSGDAEPRSGHGNQQPPAVSRRGLLFGRLPREGVE